MQEKRSVVAENFETFYNFPASDFLILHRGSDLELSPNPVKTSGFNPSHYLSRGIESIEAISDDPQRLQSLAVATNQSEDRLPRFRSLAAVILLLCSGMMSAQIGPNPPEWAQQLRQAGVAQATSGHIDEAIASASSGVLKLCLRTRSCSMQQVRHTV